MFVIWVAIVVMAVVITVAKEFIDKEAMGRCATLAWSTLVITVASAGGIFTVTRAISSERKLADVDAKYAHRRLTDAQKLALKEVCQNIALQRGRSRFILCLGTRNQPRSALTLHRRSARPAGPRSTRTWPSSAHGMAFRFGPRRCKGSSTRSSNSLSGSVLSVIGYTCLLGVPFCILEPVAVRLDSCPPLPHRIPLSEVHREC
jgi:hypothetical protein